MKNIIATIVGIIVGSAAVFLFENLIGHTLFPLPEGIDPNDMESIANNMDKIPLESKLFVVIGHFAGIIAAMCTAAIISKLSMVPSYIAGGFMLLATAFVIIALPKELWFATSDALFAIVAFFIGKSLADKLIMKQS